MHVYFPDPATYDDWKAWGSTLATALRMSQELDIVHDVGMVAEFVPPLPEGWLEANGASISMESFPELHLRLDGKLPTLTGRPGTVVGIRAG